MKFMSVKTAAVVCAVCALSVAAVAGEHPFRTALNDPVGTWRVVATDYITGKTASASFRLGQ